MTGRKACFPRKEERVLARSWLIAPPHSAHPGRRRDDCIPLESDRRDLPGADERNGDAAQVRDAAMLAAVEQTDAPGDIGVSCAFAAEQEPAGAAVT